MYKNDMLLAYSDPRERYSGSQLPLFDTYLHLDVEDTDSLLFRNVLHSLHTCAVVVAAELGMLNESVLCDEVEESFLCGEVVFAAVLFAGTGCASSVYGSGLISFLVHNALSRAVRFFRH